MTFNVRSDFAGDWVLLEDVIRLILIYGSHTDECVVMWRFRDDDGTKCDCGFRELVGGNDGEPE